MKTWFKQLDAVLRGDATKVSALRDGSLAVPVGGLTVVIAVLAAAAGACMGSYAVAQPEGAGVVQVFASAVKLPLLFALTLAVTFPSLYVFNALVGSRLTMVSVLRLLIAANGVMLAVFASLGPIVIFFGLSTTSYPFMKVLNVLAATVGGVLGLAFLLRTLHRLVLIQEANDAEKVLQTQRDAAEDFTLEFEEEAAPQPAPQAQPEGDLHAGDIDGSPTTEPDAAEPAVPPAPTPTTPADERSERIQRYIQSRGEPVTAEEKLTALDRYTPVTPGKAKAVFRVWVVVYAVVGAQMGWVLRPFIGAPNVEFTWLRGKDSNFFLDFIETLGRLLGG
ncbi:MAG: hypothetical protein ACIAXF_12815 [Phycisphaerales bacterium JB063]